MARTRTLEVVISGDASSLNRSFRSIDKEAAKVETRSQKVGRALGTLGTIAGGAAAAGMIASAHAAAAAEQSQVRLETQLKALGISYQAHARQIDTVIQKTANLAAVDDEDLQDAFTNIVRVTGDVNQSLRLTGLAADFARAKHMDIAKAGELVGKVAGGNTGILSRYGIQIDKNASASEALALLQRKFAGQAAAYGRTTAGALDRSRNATENLGESLGASLAPAVGRVANILAALITGLQRSKTASTIVVGAVAVLTAAWAAYKVQALAAAAATTIATGGLNLIIPAIVALGAGLVVAYKRSETFRNKVDGAFRGVRAAAAALGDRFNRWIIQPMEKIIGVAGRVVGALGKVGGVFGSVGGAAKGVAGALNPFGDGLGKIRALPSGGGSAGLMGASSRLAPFASIASRFGLHTSSGLRPGAITSSGNTSYHASGRAIDEAGSPQGMLGYFNYLRSNFGGRLAELIYTPGGTGVKNGRPYRYTGQVAADHYDHVHVAFTGDGHGRRRGDGIGEAARAAYTAGFRGDALRTAVAIAGAESGYRNSAENLQYPDHSIGLWQINQLAHRGRYGSDSALHNALTNARAAWAISGHGRNWGPWSTFTNGAYRGYLGRAAAAIAALTGGSRRSGGTAGRSTGGGGGGSRSTGAVPDRVNPFEESMAGAELAVAQAEAHPGNVTVNGNVVNLRQLNALSNQRAVIRNRIGQINRALGRKGLSRARRLALVQEKTQLLGQDTGLRGQIRDIRRDARAVADTATDTAAGDSQQALIDAIEANTQAQQEHSQALAGVHSELKRQTDLAAQVQSTDAFQIKKYLADLLSGQIVGAGVVPRRFTAGTATEFAYLYSYV